MRARRGEVSRAPKNAVAKKFLAPPILGLPGDQATVDFGTGNICAKPYAEQSAPPHRERIAAARGLTKPVRRHYCESKIKFSTAKQLDPSMLSMTHTVTKADKARIRMVADAMGRRAAESEIISALVDSGISKEAADEFYHLVAHGIRAGVTAGVTDGISAQQYQRGESAIWDAAFDEGRRQFGSAVMGVWLRRLAWLLIPIAALVIWFLWR